ncbi:MAG: DNA replication/repair protein RecF [Actinomycetota bacterium]
MILSWLSLADFRSYVELRWEPDPGVNILVGNNGAGKSNLLEAIGYLSNLRSFRGAPDEALVRAGAPAAVLRGETVNLDDAGRVDNKGMIEVELNLKAGRRVRLDQKRPARTADLLAKLRVITFLPEDLDLIKAGPLGRRALLDEVAVQLWPSAALDQAEFERGLRQRNVFLKQSERDQTTLDVWDARLAQAAARVMARRAQAAAALDEWLPEVYGQISGERLEIGFDYDSEWGGSLDPTVPAAEWISSMTAALARRRRVDLEWRTTGIGPHRDDPKISLAGRPARFQASQGEQRTLSLALRLATHRAISARSGGAAVLLLDDVYSELDPFRSKALTDALPVAQTMITTTRPEEVPITGRLWRVGAGQIEAGQIE